MEEKRSQVVELENPAKRPKLDESIPPAPSAEQVMKQKRKEESKKARNSRGPSQSPQPSTPPVQKSPEPDTSNIINQI